MSSGWRLNHSATTFVASRTPTCAASGICSAGNCTTGSREIWGSWLWRHNNTCSAATSTRMRPSASSQLVMTSSKSNILAPAESSSRSSVLTS
jgi:hypothetical protein